MQIFKLQIKKIVLKKFIFHFVHFFAFQNLKD